MSTYWGYHCRTDDATSECWINHGDETLASVLKAWPQIKAVREIADWYVEIRVLGGHDELLPWLDEHDGHEIELENEYGDRQMVDTPIYARVE